MKIALTLGAIAIVLSSSAIARADATNEDVMPPARPRIEARGAGGASYRTFFGIPTTMGTMDLGLGARLDDHFSAYGGLDFDLGQTDHGLATRRFDFSPTAEWIAGRLRYGAGVDVLWFDVQRASTGDRIGQAGTGVHLQASVDPVQTSVASLFIGARVGADLMIGPPTIVSGSMLGASAMGGVRF